MPNFRFTPIRRELDRRRVQSDFIQRIRAEVRRMSGARTEASSVLGPVTRAHAHSRSPFRSYDCNAGVVLVCNRSDLPQYRAQAARILGRPVQVIHADTLGTIYAPEA